jgi:DNA-binding MarR family transcriptional regulator
MSSVAFERNFANSVPVADSTRAKMLHGLQELIATLAPAESAAIAPDAGHVEDLVRARRQRAKFFNPELFADPAWDMLLELYAAALSQRRVSVSSLCIASGVAATTALRWMSALQKDGLIARENDPLDGRRVFVKLSAKGQRSIEDYFLSLPPGVTPL